MLLLFYRYTVFISPLRRFHMAVMVLFWVRNLRKRYPIGTVAKIDYDGKHYYFVAINDVNRYGKPEKQNYANVDIALSGLIKTINTVGYCDDLAMPLIGTGRAAIREATIEKVIEKIVDRFLTSTDKICRKLIICIRPKDYLEGKVDLDKIQKYINYKCKFKWRKYASGLEKMFAELQEEYHPCTVKKYFDRSIAGIRTKLRFVLTGSVLWGAHWSPIRQDQ